MPPPYYTFLYTVTIWLRCSPHVFTTVDFESPELCFAYVDSVYHLLHRYEIFRHEFTCLKHACGHVCLNAEYLARRSGCDRPPILAPLELGTGRV